DEKSSEGTDYQFLHESLMRPVDADAFDLVHLRQAGSLLRRNHEMGAAVFKPFCFAVRRVERELLAIAHRTEPVRRNAQRHQIRLYRHRSALAESEVVLGRAPLAEISFVRN